MNKKYEIISGFPGIGKTYYKQNINNFILDSDSSRFSWIKKDERNLNFPKNYIDHIKNSIPHYDLILISSHKIVREALVSNNLFFTLIFPERDLKEEYILRFKKRGSPQNFINMMEKNWEVFIDEMENQKGCKIIKLKSHQFLQTYLRYKNKEEK